MTPSRTDRIQGALMGAFIGDALGVGPHWYYDLSELRRLYGPWIDHYTAPQPGHYHAGSRPGEASQSGLLLALTAESLVARGGYDEADFCRRLDEELFPHLNGEGKFGPGGFTSHSMRDLWRARQAGRPWGEIASDADNTEAVERLIALAARYAHDPAALFTYARRHVALTQGDPTVGAMSVAFALVLGQLIAGEPLDAALSGKLMAKMRTGELPFCDAARGGFASPDALLTAGSIAQGVQDHGVRVEPAWAVSLLYGLPCAVYHQLPAVYHLAARFQGDFEAGVLHAINGGGQNLSRAMLTGALCGAIGGLQAIPERFVRDLHQSAARLRLSGALAAQALAAASAP